MELFRPPKGGVTSFAGFGNCPRIAASRNETGSHVGAHDSSFVWPMSEPSVTKRREAATGDVRSGAGSPAANHIEAVHWATIGDPRAADRDLMRYARTHGYVYLRTISTSGLCSHLLGPKAPAFCKRIEP